MKTARATQQQAAQQTAPAAAKARPAPVRAAAPSARRSSSPLIRAASPAVRLSASSQASTAASLPGLSSGEPLSPDVQNALEKSFQVNLRGVRVHTGAHAQKASANLSARAFTYGNHIFLGPGERPTDIGLMAHETAHVVQQQGGSAVQRSAPGQSDVYEHEAQRASASVLRGEPFTVREQTGHPRAQGFLGIDLPNPLTFIANQANNIPGFRMFTIILGVNPINMSPVARSAANIMRAIVEFMPGGGLITQALDNYGIFDKVGAWVEQQIATLGLVGSSIKQAVTEFIASLSPGDILHLGDVWERAKRIFTEPIDRIISFAKGLVNGIIDLIKDAILRPIAKLAEGTEGYNLLKGVLGKDPITGDPVERSAETLLGPFMKLIGQGEVWENMKKAHAIDRCWQWFQSTMTQLAAFVSEVPTLFVTAFKSLTLEDIILVPKAFAKLASVFGGFLGKFVSWGANAVWELLQIIFDVVSPGAWSYIKRTGAALKSILKNPLPFVGNLVKAAKLGFQNFASNFGAHLKAGLLDWLTGSLPGIYIPKSFSLGEIVKFVFSVLGLTWQNVRVKLVKVLGEPAVKAMEVGFDIVVTLVTQGPAAAWDKIKDQLSNLKDTIIGGIVDMVVEMVVTKAVPKLIAMFIPGAGFISAIISIYDTIMVFVNKISKIIQVVTGFINSIVAIAAGQIGAAASRVESTLAGLLSLAINFLAGFAGLGKVADKIMGVIQKVRAPIDKALDALINWIVTMAKKLFAKIFGKKDGKKDEKPGDVTARAGQMVVDRLAGSHSDEEIQTVVNQVKQELAPAGLQRLEFGPPNSEGDSPLIAQASPPKTVAKKKKPSAKTASVVMVARIIFNKDALQAIEGSRSAAGGQPAPPLKFIPQEIPKVRKGQVPGAVSGVQEVAPVGTPPSDQYRLGTMLIKPSPGATEAKVMSWNSGFPVEGSNSSHAEKFFDDWFSHATGIRNAVKEIHVTINLSPCSLCAGDLPVFKGSGIQASLNYQTAYEGRDKKTKILYSNTTTVEDIGALSARGWSVGGPAPKWTNATKEKERKAGQAVLERIS